MLLKSPHPIFYTPFLVEKKISEDLGNLVIGDMIIPNPLSTRTAFMKKEWPNGIVPYKIHTSVSSNNTKNSKEVLFLNNRISYLRIFHF